MKQRGQSSETVTECNGAKHARVAVVEMYCKADGCIDRPHKTADGLFDAWNERTCTSAEMHQFCLLTLPA